MEGPFKSVLEYIRSLFSGPFVERDRKRRASVLDIPIKSKISRLSNTSSTGTSRIIPIQQEGYDSILPRKSESFKRSYFPLARRSPMRPLRAEDVIVLDDNEEPNEGVRRSFNNSCRNENQRQNKGFSSTPIEKKHSVGRMSFNSDNGDVILVKTTPKETQTPLLSQSRNMADKSLFTIGNGCATGAKPKDRSGFKSANASILDYTYRLEDKKQYRKLLEQSTSNNSSVYFTPMGKLFKNYDVTHSNLDKSLEKPKESTRERIIRVLDSWENDTVEVKDSDSEESVVLVNPPSPKPDIKVDPVNSFKKIVDSSEVTKKDWLDRMVESHKQFVEQRQRDIDDLRQFSRQTEEINRDINLELLRRRVNDCLQFKEIILPEIVVQPEAELPKLTNEQLDMVHRVLKGNPNEVLAQKFNLNITRRDLMTLAGLNWLNDEVINFYMNLIIERGKESDKYPKTWAFNTFFYMKLIKDGPQSLRRWTKKIDLFSYDLICIPIHLGMHWCMAIIDFRDNSIRYYDSMGSPNNKCLDALRRYLEAEHLDKKGISYNTSEFTLENMENIPQQMNGSDCGMFSCTFAEFISRNAKITFGQEDMPYLRKKMIVEIMTGELLIK
ncbi:hypothetical protein ABEB36_013091 [Hypothenemus hampei]|uniref:Ubiquitin-like protease family profile domain-containing protein n=1 Tax=Hypothenemus hampei TaxID=57062 RepID=A0ABD1E8U7_HYPHA